MSLTYWRALAEVWPWIWIHDLGRYLVVAAAFFLVLSVWLRSALAKRRIQNRLPGGAQIRREIVYSIVTATIFSSTGLFLYFGTLAGATKIYTDIAIYGEAYWLSSIVLVIVLHDAYFYWTHRMLHHPKIFPHAHRVHHLSQNPSPWAAYAFHPWEALVNALYIPLLALVLPLHPGAIGVFLAFMIVRNVWGHSGVELFPKGFASRPITRWITSTTHHDLHHQHTHGNYGLYFTWWDEWLGTTNPRYLESFDQITADTK